MRHELQGTFRGKDADDPWISLQIRVVGFVYVLFVLFGLWTITDGFSAAPRFPSE